MSSGSNNLFLSAASVEDLLLAQTEFDVFKLLGGMSDEKAKSAVRALGDKYSRVLDGESRAMDPYDIIGVGATLNQATRGGQIILSSPPREGSPADRAGLRYGDRVVAVNGRPTRGRSVFDIVEQVSEDMEAETVKLAIEKADGVEGGGAARDVLLRRDFSNVPDPVAFGVSERRPDGTVVGYVRLREFNSRTARGTNAAVLALKGQGANALVVDVRGNGGGALQSALWTAKLFLGGGEVIMYSVQGSNSVAAPYRAKGSGDAIVGPGVPIVVLIARAQD